MKARASASERRRPAYSVSLPSEQAAEMSELWEEYEAQGTSEARFALALDRLMPLLHNYHTGGVTWRENQVTRTQVEERMARLRLVRMHWRRLSMQCWNRQRQAACCPSPGQKDSF